MVEQNTDCHSKKGKTALGLVVQQIQNIRIFFRIDMYVYIYKQYINIYIYMLYKYIYKYNIMYIYINNIYTYI